MHVQSFKPPALGLLERMYKDGYVDAKRPTDGSYLMVGAEASDQLVQLDDDHLLHNLAVSATRTTQSRVTRRRCCRSES